jgi:predicted glutamine amidotransferase
MCRLFAVQAKVKVDLEPYLVSHKKSLSAQSHEHKDGWGAVLYPDHCKVDFPKSGEDPVYVRNPISAYNDPDFAFIPKAAEAFSKKRTKALVHLRRATIGNTKIENCHPFFMKSISFAHNGEIGGFLKVKAEILKFIDPVFYPHIQGDTDSEFIFYLILSHGVGGSRRERLISGVRKAYSILIHLAEVHKLPELIVNTILMDPYMMLAVRYNRELHFKFVDEGRDMGIMVSSEKMDSSWNPLKDHSLMIVDRDQSLTFEKIQ